MSMLRTKLPKYLKELVAVYGRQKQSFKRDVVTHCRWSMRENTEYDRWNGGMDGHTVVLFAPLDIIATVTFAERNKIALEMRDDLRELATTETEYFAAVYIEADDESDPEYQAATPYAARPVIEPDSLSIWQQGLARVFMSHRDAEKMRVQMLADALSDYGMSCFVAHSTIPADEEWQKVIVSGLETMEVMVAIVTDDFHQSVYCMQEVGYALGRGIPVISLKVDNADPLGFIAHKQALRGSLNQPLVAARHLFPLIGERLRQIERFNEVLIKSFCEAPDYTEAKSRFERMTANVKKLSNEQAQQIIEAFSENNQLHNAGYLTSRYQRLIQFMNRAAGGYWQVEGRELRDTTASVQDDLDDFPF